MEYDAMRAYWINSGEEGIPVFIEQLHIHNDVFSSGRSELSENIGFSVNYLAYSIYK